MFARSRTALPTGRLPTAVFGGHAGVMAIRIVFTGSLALPTEKGIGDPLLIAFTLESVAFAAATSLLPMGLAKETAPHRWKAAAQFDSPTGALSRSAFPDRASRQCGRSGRNVLAIADLDHFKAIDDTCGHAAGDETLRIFARVLGASLGRGAVVGRLGGEEFAIVLPREDALAGQHALGGAMARFTATASQALRLPGPAMVSLGVVEYDRRSGLDALMARADAALYEAKRNGRNRIVIAAPAAPGAPRAPARTSRVAERPPSGLTLRAAGPSAAGEDPCRSAISSIS